jgi:serine/threonine protein kinase
MANLEQSAEQLFGVALDLPPEQRAAFLDRACGDVAELRRMVDDLLANHDRLGSFLGQPLCHSVNGSALSGSISSLHSYLTAGTNLGHYCIVQPLGSGGMGVVYLARDVILNRNVALKILPVELSKSKDLLYRFEREALAASSLNHPNIVTIYERGQEGSTHYIAMELIEGKTLRQLLDTGLLPIRKTIEIAAQIAEGLARAHEAGIAHRDLKPENLMVLPDGLVKILDFGLAKHALGDFEPSRVSTRAALHTQPGLILGTMQYMSPEQASGGSSDRPYPSVCGTLMSPLHFAGQSRGAWLKSPIAVTRPPGTWRVNLPPYAITSWKGHKSRMNYGRQICRFSGLGLSDGRMKNSMSRNCCYERICGWSR